VIELLALMTVAAASGAAYVRSRDFVARRLRYVDRVQRPSAPVIAGAVAIAAAAPVVWALPVIGAGSAVIFGCAVGAGTRAGARAAAAPAR
jgi:hypothetical protein